MLDTSALISILMSIRNAEPFLVECLESIRDQSWKEWELLAVDDHSTDASAAILESFARQDSRIQPLRNPGKGIIPALRHAFSRSRGQLITRMDADDRMANFKLETLAQVLRERRKGHVVAGKVSYFSQSKLGAGYRKYADWLNGVVAENNWQANLYRECVLPSPCWMAFRDDLAWSGAFEGSRYPEDYDLCFRLRSAGLRFVGVPEVLHFWRDHPARSSRTQKVYRENSFFELKLDWFLRLDRDFDRPLCLWGAGKRGKEVARRLQHRGAIFRWITDNPEKQGKNIYGIAIEAMSDVRETKLAQWCIVVSSQDERKEIRDRLAQKGVSPSALFSFR